MKYKVTKKKVSLILNSDTTKLDAVVTGRTNFTRKPTHSAAALQTVDKSITSIRTEGARMFRPSMQKYILTVVWKYRHVLSNTQISCFLTRPAIILIIIKRIHFIFNYIFDDFFLAYMYREFDKSKFLKYLLLIANFARSLCAESNTKAGLIWFKRFTRFNRYIYISFYSINRYDQSINRI